MILDCHILCRQQDGPLHTLCFVQTLWACDYSNLPDFEASGLDFLDLLDSLDSLAGEIHAAWWHGGTVANQSGCGHLERCSLKTGSGQKANKSKHSVLMFRSTVHRVVTTSVCFSVWRECWWRWISMYQARNKFRFTSMSSSSKQTLWTIVDVGNVFCAFPSGQRPVLCAIFLGAKSWHHHFVWALVLFPSSRTQRKMSNYMQLHKD